MNVADQVRGGTAIGNKQPPKFKEAEEVFRKMVGSMRLHSPVPPAH